jgi:AraC-like DNA-binding protein
MLRYVGLGYRRFGINPVQSPPRANWEFFAVVSGTCAPVLGDAPSAQLKANTLWVFPAGSSHGWTGNGPHRAYITAFHFGVVPPPLEAAARDLGHLEVTLDPAERRHLAELAKRMHQEREHPTTLSTLQYQSVLLDLSLLVLRKLPRIRRPLPPSPAEKIVDSACAWYGIRLANRPSVEEVAREVHVSPSTLRRMFQEVRHQTPLEVFSRLRLEASMKLLAESSLKLEDVATACGYSCASDFCRAFKADMNRTPASWRRALLTGPGYIRK